MLSINPRVLQRGGWFLDPTRRRWHGVSGGVLDQQVLDVDGEPRAPAEGQLCCTEVALNCGIYTQGSAIVCIVNPAKKKYSSEDRYWRLYEQLNTGKERTADVWYSLPFDCSADSTYQKLCESLPSQLAHDAANLHLYSDPEDAPSMNISVFVRLSDKLLRRAGQRKKRKTSVFFQLGRFQFAGASDDRRKILLRPRAQRNTCLARAATNPRDTGAASRLLEEEEECPRADSSQQPLGPNPRDVLRTNSQGV